MEATLNVTVNGFNGTLPDLVNYDATDGDVKQWATEAVRSGGVPGIPADPTVDFHDFVVARIAAFATEDGQELPNRILLHPKTPFGE